MENNKKIYFLLSTTLLLILTSVQILFYYQQKTIGKNKIELIDAVLQQELTGSNLFLISRALHNLQNLKIVSCIKLKQKDQKDAYLDLSFQSKCTKNEILLNGAWLAHSFSSLNGQEWKISFKSNNDKVFYVNLWITRALSFLLTIIGFIGALTIYKKEREKKELADKEKNRIRDLSLQINHDIKTPLSIISLLTHKIENIEVKNLFNQAFKNTNNILNDFEKIRDFKVSSNEATRQNTKVKIKKTNKINSLHEIKSTFALQETTLATRKGLILKGATFHISGQINKEKQITTLNSILAPLVKQFASINSNIKFYYSNNFPNFSVPGSHSDYTRIFTNIISNGIDALNKEPDQSTKKMNIWLELNKDKFSLWFSDNGPGICKSIYQNIFLKNFSYKKAKGTGLGLWHAKKTLNEVGLSIELY